MTKGMVKPGPESRHGTLRDQVREMVDAGMPAGDIRDHFDAEGANPSTVDAYIHVYLPPVGDAWMLDVRVAFELHLQDLIREHGGFHAA